MDEQAPDKSDNNANLKALIEASSQSIEYRKRYMKQARERVEKTRNFATAMQMKFEARQLEREARQLLEEAAWNGEMVATLTDPIEDRFDMDVLNKQAEEYRNKAEELEQTARRLRRRAEELLDELR